MGTNYVMLILPCWACMAIPSLPATPDCDRRFSNPDGTDSDGCS
jgi:hypothetical protein